MVGGAVSLRVGFVLAAMLVAGCAAGRGTIGAVIGQRADGHVFLRDVPRDLAAYRAGLRDGDEVLLIDGRDVRTMTPEQLHQALSGDVGDPVKLTLVRDERVLRVTIRRSQARKLKVRPSPPVLGR